jgi:hypothetical protein
MMNAISLYLTVRRGVLKDGLISMTPLLLPFCLANFRVCMATALVVKMPISLFTDRRKCVKN